MSGFWEDVWNNIWTGWTPVLMAGLFILGLTMAKKFAELGVSNSTVFVAYLLGCTIIPLSLPVFVTMKK